MPKRYLGIKRDQKRQGKSEKAAQESAARIYNATRKPGQKPVTGKHRATGKRTTRRA